MQMQQRKTILKGCIESLKEYKSFIKCCPTNNGFKRKFVGISDFVRHLTTVQILDINYIIVMYLWKKMILYTIDGMPLERMPKMITIAVFIS